jgi:hypothetical protein
MSKAADVFVFNPFAEGYIAQGSAFTPVKHQAMLAENLANLSLFLCQPDDVVLLEHRPTPAFLESLKEAGFPLPKFVELKEGRIDPDRLCHRKLGRLRPWAWGPDSVKLLEPLFAQSASGAGAANQYFNDGIARLYSKGWSADFLRKVLERWGGRSETAALGAEPQSLPDAAAAEGWLCSEQEAGRVVDTPESALRAIAAIRDRGHHRVVVKEAYGLAGHNAIRLWEPELLPAQRQWLVHALRNGRQQLVVEPWLERELDFSVQLEMGPGGLKLCGYTGLVNDRKGQFLANWAEADYGRCLPARVAPLLSVDADVSGLLQRLYGKSFSLLEAELQRVGFTGPVSIDAFVYRTPRGECQLKPVVEINPRYTMGRLTVELMKRACPGSCGLFRLVSQGQAREEGFADLPAYAHSLRERLPLRLEGAPIPKIRQGAVCLNDPERAQVCLATFEVSPTLNLSSSLNAGGSPASN